MNADDQENPLEQFRSRIDRMSKTQHIELLRILKTDTTIKLNENKSGVYINMSFLSPTMLGEIAKYIQYIDVQENALFPLEIEKESYKNSFFGEKENKDEIISYNSIGVSK